MGIRVSLRPSLLVHFCPSEFLGSIQLLIQLLSLLSPSLFIYINIVFYFFHKEFWPCLWVPRSFFEGNGTNTFGFWRFVPAILCLDSLFLKRVLLRVREIDVFHLFQQQRTQPV